MNYRKKQQNHVILKIDTIRCDKRLVQIPFTMFRFLKNTLAKLSFSDTPVLLGRWNLDYCTYAVHRKVTWSNEDHCGVCDIKVAKKEDDDSLVYVMMTDLYM